MNFFIPKRVDLPTFDVNMSRVAFTRFCCQIHQSARIGIGGGGVKQILAGFWKLCNNRDSYEHTLVAEASPSQFVILSNQAKL